jgi:hypothetical protein
MNKKLFVGLALVMSVQAFAQQADTVYVVFTPTASEVQGVWEFVFNEADDDPYDYYRYPVREYTILNRSEDYDFMFEYVNLNTEPPKPILSRPLSFLDTEEYIDWDVVGPTLTKEQAEELIAEILAHDKIYFIRRVVQPQSVRPESPGNLTLERHLELVPVGPLRSRF